MAFRSLDATAVAEYFSHPSLMITPEGVFAFTTARDVEQAYGRVMGELPARGYSHTEFGELTERRLSDDLALVAGNGVWKNTRGDELSHFGVTYTWRRVGDAWRIVVAAIHEPDLER